MKRHASCLIELPLKCGLTNIRHLLRDRSDEDDKESWAVRYYRWHEVREMFVRVFGSVSVSSDCFCGIGVRPEDIDLLPWKYKPIVVVSEFLKRCTRVCPPFIRLSDSVFVGATKEGPVPPGLDRAPR